MLAYVPSLMQVIVVEMIGAFFVSVGIATYAARRGVIGCAGDPEIAVGPTQIVVVLLGVVMVGWTLWRIFWPTLVRHGVYSQVRIFLGNLHLAIPYREVGTLDFPSTHPAYAPLEAVLFCFFAIPLLALGTRGEFVGCSLQYSFVLWWSFVPLLFAFPALRLIAWYVLRRQYPGAAQVRYANNAAQAVYVPFGITLTVAVFLFGSVLLPPLWAKRLDAQSFAGGLPAQPALDGAKVNIRGTLRTEPRTCACAAEKPRACYVADALIDIGGSDVVVRGLSDHARLVLQLAEGGTGREVSLYGQLTRTPKASGTSVACPADPFPASPARPRAYLELL